MKERILDFKGQKSYVLDIFKIPKLRRELEVTKVSEKVWIAYFMSLGDTEFIEKSAKELLKKISNLHIDYLLTAPSKGIAIAHALARLMKINYIVCRNEIRSYMKNPIYVKYVPVTSDKEKMIVLDGRQVEEMKGKNIAIIDDVVSTGETLKAMKKIVEMAGGNNTKSISILLEGPDYNDKDLVYLDVLPIFVKK